MSIDKSIIDNNIDVPVIYDVDLEGGVDEKGNIKQVWGAEALKNAIKMWIASFKGEVLRDPDRSGYVAYALFRSMNDVTADDIEMIIRDGIDQDFVPPLDIIDLSVTPNYKERYWEIYLEVYSSVLKIRTVVSEKIKAQV